MRLDQKPGDYAIRLTSLRREQIIQGIGILRYPPPPPPPPALSSSSSHNATATEEELAAVVVVNDNDTDTTPPPATRPWVHLNGSLHSADLVAMDETKLAPYPARPPPATADNTLKFVVKMTGPSAWVLHMAPHHAFRQQLPPLLWHESSRGSTTYGGGDDSGKSSEGGVLRNGSVVDIVLENGAHVVTQHPFHKHNHKAWIIGTGTGGFPWASVDEALREGGEAVRRRFNLVDPPIRDGCRLGNRTGDWTVIRYEISFPAASMLHCHMIHHFGVRYRP